MGLIAELRFYQAEPDAAKAALPPHQTQRVTGGYAVVQQVEAAQQQAEIKRQRANSAAAGFRN